MPPTTKLILRPARVFPSARAFNRLRSSSTYAHLVHELPRRRLPPIYSDLTPGNSHALAVSLASFLPATWTSTCPTVHGDYLLSSAPPLTSLARPLPPAHHLVYFNPVIAAESLLPDGTDPLQSPGAPFVRRMWAGGYVRFGEPDAARLDGSRWVCVEGIRDVAVKGKDGEEKVFVGIERRIGRAGPEEDEGRGDRERLWTEREEDWGEAAVIERRNIVFMRGRTPQEAKVEVERARGRMLFPQHPADFSHTLTPTPSLLFRYSALTFNAHAIHLDPAYCRAVEGHRNLLFHGPLACTLLATMLQNGVRPRGQVVQLEYRNLAPLYCDEPVKLCMRKAESNGKNSSSKGDKYEVWAETPEGGIAVKGTGYVVPASDVPA